MYKDSKACSEHIFEHAHTNDDRLEEFIMRVANCYGVQDIRLERAHQRKLIRQIQIRNQLLILLLAAFIVLSISFLFNSFSAKASVEANKTYKYFKSIEVQSGDTLWSIAEANKDEHYVSTAQYIKEVKSMNSLSNNTITTGQHIMIPYYSSELK